jgi:hypothetical protein
VLESERFTAKNRCRELAMNHVIVDITDGYRLSRSSTADCAELLQFCAWPTAPTLPHQEIATSMTGLCERLRDRAGGRKIVPLHKKPKREVTHAKQS